MVQYIKLFVCLSLSTFILFGCEEEYNTQPPFTAVNDTVYLDAENWFFQDIDPVEKEGAQIFPFAYHILDRTFDGYIFSSESRIYLLEGGRSLPNRRLFLDLNAAPGDTLYNPSALQYLLLLDRRYDENIRDEIFYLMQRSRKGVSSFQERSIWVISQQNGLLAAADYEVEQSDGSVTLEEVIGEPDHFKEENGGLFQQIKRYDHRITYHIDQDRYLIYEFDKSKGLLKSRNYVDSEDLYQYEFDPQVTQTLVDFQIKQRGNLIILHAENNCYTFSQSLELLEMGSCL